LKRPLSLAFVFITPPEAPGFALRTWVGCVQTLLPKPRRLQPKKKPCAGPLPKRKPNAGLVSLTMACLSYLLVKLTLLLKLIAGHARQKA
jgi:hypothetical protein